MSLIKKIGGKSKPQTLLDQVQEVGGKLIVGGYRSLASRNKCPPTEAVADAEIIATYSEVGTAFREASHKRGEHLPAGTMNFIVWKFLVMRETMGKEMMDSHLEYEIEKYLREGLREDYRQDLNLF
jgi:hypothetical protein